MNIWERIKEFICRDCINSSNAWYGQLRTCDDKYGLLFKKHNEDTKYYDQQIKFLTEQLVEAKKGYVDAKPFIKTLKIINNPHFYYNGYGIILSRVADNQYYAPTLDEWKVFLTKIQKQITAKWKEDVFDCDQFALVMTAMVNESVYQSGFYKGVAFWPAWSDNHAFCTFITNDGLVYLYEPQSDKIIEWQKNLKYQINGLNYSPLKEVYFIS